MILPMMVASSAYFTITLGGLRSWGGVAFTSKLSGVFLRGSPISKLKSVVFKPRLCSFPIRFMAKILLNAELKSTNSILMGLECRSVDVVSFVGHLVRPFREGWKKIREVRGSQLKQFEDLIRTLLHSHKVWGSPWSDPEHTGSSAYSWNTSGSCKMSVYGCVYVSACVNFGGGPSLQATWLRSPRGASWDAWLEWWFLAQMKGSFRQLAGWQRSVTVAKAWPWGSSHTKMESDTKRPRQDFNRYLVWFLSRL